MFHLDPQDRRPATASTGHPPGRSRRRGSSDSAFDRWNAEASRSAHRTPSTPWRPDAQRMPPATFPLSCLLGREFGRRDTPRRPRHPQGLPCKMHDGHCRLQGTDTAVTMVPLGENRCAAQSAQHTFMAKATQSAPAPVCARSCGSCWHDCSNYSSANFQLHLQSTDRANISKDDTL
jgi:hypothetical protein